VLEEKNEEKQEIEKIEKREDEKIKEQGDVENYRQ